MSRVTDEAAAGRCLARLLAINDGAAVDVAVDGPQVHLKAQASFFNATTIACALRLERAALALIAAGCGATDVTMVTAACNALDDVVACLHGRTLPVCFAGNYLTTRASAASRADIVPEPITHEAAAAQVTRCLRWRRGSSRRAWLEAFCAASHPDVAM